MLENAIFLYRTPPKAGDFDCVKHKVTSGQAIRESKQVLRAEQITKAHDTRLRLRQIANLKRSFIRVSREPHTACKPRYQLYVLIAYLKIKDTGIFRYS